MSGNCSSSPLSGCTDAQSITSLGEFSDNFKEHLVTINIKKGAILTQIDDCCEVTNGNLINIKDILEQIKNHAIECCKTINSNLDDVLGAIQTILDGGGPCDTGTTTEHGVPDTTEEPVEVTTTSGEPVEVTTTSEQEESTTTSEEVAPVVYSGVFELGSTVPLICEGGDEEAVTLYYTGTWNENNDPDSMGGMIMFRDAICTFQVNRSTTHKYIRKSDSPKVYDLSELGAAGDFYYDCEA